MFLKNEYVVFNLQKKKKQVYNTILITWININKFECCSFYVFCCCWLIEDCFTGRRYGPPRPPFGIPDQQPALPRPPIGPAPVGITGSHLSHFGPSGSMPQPGPIGYGYPGEPPRF